MKKEYYSTFIRGLEEPVERMLRKTGGVSVERVMPGAALYRSVREPELACLYRNYQLLCAMRTEKSIDDAVRRLQASDAWVDRLDYERIQGKNFRVVTAADGQPCAANMRYLSMLEKMIAEQTGMRANRERPQVELWVNLRMEGTYFLWRLREAEGKKNADPLRRDLCEVLAFLAAPQARDAVILGITGTNLAQALSHQGASSVSAVLADHAGSAASKINAPGLRLLPGSPGHTGLEDGKAGSVLLCLAPKGSLSIQEEDLRSAVREAVRILDAHGHLLLFYPNGFDRVFRRLTELNLVEEYSVILSGESCQAKVLTK